VQRSGRVTSTSIGKNSLQDLFRLLPLILKRTGVLLVVLHIAREISLQLLNYLAADVQASGRENMPALMGLVGLNFFCEILWSAIWSFVLISATRASLRQEPLWSERSVTDFNQLLIEGVRGLSAVLWRLPLAIVPGLIELLRLLFVPHVVLLEPLYQRGQVDALKRSRQAIRSKWVLILIVTLVSLALSSGVDWLTQGSSSEAYFWQAPGAFFLSVVLTLFINLVYEVYLVALFLRLNLRFDLDGSTV
jgi:hypothetical protein